MNLKLMLDSIRSGFLGDSQPHAVEYCKVGNLYWVNIIGKNDGLAISDQIFSGFDSSYEVAFKKAISEKIEREAFKNGFLEKINECQTERSDGFAAFPKNDPSSASNARDNALEEAIERYVWASWWDDHSISYSHQVIIENEQRNLLGPAIGFIKSLREILPIGKLHFIEPKFAGFDAKEVLIFVLEVNDGVITGGACGGKENRAATIQRAISELYRHGLVLHQKPNLGEQSSFYEDRLRFFASLNGLNLFLKRLSTNGKIPVILPDLKFDNKIPHKAEKTHTVHRCLFENQPPFIGGNLERMCL